LLPSLENAWGKAPEVLRNAERHYDAGCHWAEKEDWGFATAHMVLSTEEAAKAAILAIHGLGGLEYLQVVFDRLAGTNKLFDTLKVDLHRFFDEIQRWHKQKHVAALYLLVLFWAMQRWGDGIQTEEDVGRLLKCIMGDFVSGREEPTSLWGAWCWLAQADQLKQQGFYEDVDQPGPAEICGKEFIQAKAVAGSLIGSLKEVQQRWQQGGWTRESFIRDMAGEKSRLLVLVDREVPRIFNEQAIQKVYQEQESEWEAHASGDK
jgi:hypothetical protein